MDKLKNQNENGESSIFTLLASLLIIARHLIAFLLASCPARPAAAKSAIGP